MFENLENASFYFEKLAWKGWLIEHSGVLFSKHNRPTTLSSWNNETSSPNNGTLSTLITFIYSLFFGSVKFISE